MSIAAGTKLGSYEILSAIGAGGMGEVYRARDAKLGRDVAIKVLPEAFARDAERMVRFEREAKVLASLNHPNIATIHGLEDSSNVHALVMELVEGLTLADRIKSGPIPIDESLRIAKQICEALEYAHERGIVHRDLKPANVKVTPDDAVKILDFGLAKAIEGDASSMDMSNSPTLTHMATQAGILLGTAAYMSPEQAKAKPVDRRADIWSFGCVLYEMLTGKKAFDGETITDTLAAVVRAEPDLTPLPANTPARVRVLLQRCLQKDAKQRLRDIGDARISLDEVISGAAEPSGAAAAATMTFAPRWPRALPWAVAALLAIALVGSVYVHSRPNFSNPQPVVRAVIPIGAAIGDLAFSPDGSRLAFTSGTGWRTLHWRDLSQRAAKDIPAAEDSHNPFFSPDGRWLGFFSGDKLMKIDLSGGSPQEICSAEGGTGADWGDDGSIFFTDSAGFYVVSAAGGQPRPITTVTSSGARDFSFPQILPGGKTALITMVGTHTDNYKVALVPLTGTGMRPTILIDGAEDAHFFPSGHLLFVKDGDLNAVPFDLDHLDVTGQSTNLQIPLAGVAVRGWASYSVARDGTLVYAVANEAYSNNSLVWVDRNGGITTLSIPEQRYSDPQISPDGRRLVVGVDGKGDASQNLWLFDFARQILSRLTFGDKLDYAPVWTPDGNRIVFVSPGPTWRMFEVPTDGSSPEEQIWSSSSPIFPTSFSPDGRALALSLSKNGHTAIEILRFRDLEAAEPAGPPVPFVTNPFNNVRAEFSPDGHWILFQSDQSGSPQLYVRPYPGPGGQVQVSTDGGSGGRWSRDGRQIFYRNGDKMMAVSVAAKPQLTADRPEIIFQGHYTAYDAVLNYDVDPGGNRFLMQSGGSNTASSEIDVLVNWGGQLSRIVKQGKQ
ncbi:MAG: protein kinase [Candidatus Acidiferrales bacterium]